ncbi:MAG TPA: phosphatase PAP2 family protein [Steroidobacteraceae bacterium]
MTLGTLLIAATLSLSSVVGQAADEAPYLPPERVPNGVTILPPPPRAGSPAARADRAIFAVTRKLRGTARWQIATDDVTNTALDRYACALGLQLTPAAAPAVTRLLDRAGTGLLVDPVKTHYHTRRPFVGTRAPICEAKSDHLIGNGDYPSGHAANGWLEALILAELAPERATALLSRGRAYGESRVVCGSHTASAVEGGWIAGTVMFAALNAEPRFRHDLDEARRELAAISADAVRPDPHHCESEDAVLAGRPW